MPAIDGRALDAALDELPHRYPGPGGVAGIVHEGRVIDVRAWGHANPATRTPMTRKLRLPICSITKQFTCAVLMSAFSSPEELDFAVAQILPNYRDPLPTVRQLCNNQSGLRDYWALTILQGAHPEQGFPREDALPLLARMKTGHFTPGTRYSYNNGNFRILAEIIERETGRSMADLLARHAFGPAGMETAVLAPDTRLPLDDVVGHEGSDMTGFLPADNGIYWVGDAGVSASLDDMLAWESWIDGAGGTEDGIYARLSRPVSFSDGQPASYGFGLAHSRVAGERATGHGGALRGFRAHRLHIASRRLSAVVMFNHHGDARAAAAGLLSAALGEKQSSDRKLEGDWDGLWLCPETGLTARVAGDGSGATLRFGTGPDRLVSGSDRTLRAAGLLLERRGERLYMRRAKENLATLMDPLPPVRAPDTTDLDGRYHSAELGADMHVEVRDGGIHAWFNGMLGTGPAERLHPVTQDIWHLATRRSMDAPAPGDWTLRLRRDERGQVQGALLGCWLARNVPYVKLA